MLKLKFDVAKCLYEEARRISPYLDTYINLGDTYRFMGDTDNALYYHKAALKLIKDEQAEKENAVAGAIAINYMPVKPGDTDTTKTYISVYTLEEKKALTYYELCLDYAIKGDFANASKMLANAAQFDADKQYEDFVKNKAVALIKFSKPPINHQAQRWFKMQRWTSGTERPLQNFNWSSEYASQCPAVADILNKN